MNLKIKNMKNLFRIVTAISLIILTSASFAQQFGIRGGFNLSNMLIELEGEKVPDLKMNPGFQIGGFVDFPIGNTFSIETDLLVSTKGVKMVEESGYGGDNYEAIYKMNLLSLVLTN